MVHHPKTAEVAFVGVCARLASTSSCSRVSLGVRRSQERPGKLLAESTRALPPLREGGGGGDFPKATHVLCVVCVCVCVSHACLVAVHRVLPPRAPRAALSSLFFSCFFLHALLPVLSLAQGKLVVVDFSAEWCGPCKFIAPVFEAMSVEHGDVVFIHVDVDVLEDLPDGSDVRGVPTFKFFKDGRLLESFSGASKEKLSENIAKFK